MRGKLESKFRKKLSETLDGSQITVAKRAEYERCAEMWFNLGAETVLEEISKAFDLGESEQ